MLDIICINGKQIDDIENILLWHLYYFLDKYVNKEIMSETKIVKF